jgi:hypothetical protein
VDEGTLKTILDITGLPVAYHHFKTPPEPPYIVYLFAYSSNFGADNKVHKEIPNYQVELYTKSKDPSAEALIEDLLDANDIYWDKSVMYIESEGLYQVLYEI